MVRPEQLQTGTRVRGLTAEGSATIESVNWHGDQASEVVFEGGHGVQNQAVDDAVDRTRLRQLLRVRALVRDSTGTSRIRAPRAAMEPAHAFFQKAFDRLGGKIRLEPGRFEVTHVLAVRERDRHVGAGAPALKRHERVCFEKDLAAEQPRALLVCPGGPPLDATLDLEHHRDILRRGAQRRVPRSGHAGQEPVLRRSSDTDVAGVQAGVVRLIHPHLFVKDLRRWTVRPQDRSREVGSTLIRAALASGDHRHA